jgi:hypothetical protein
LEAAGVVDAFNNSGMTRNERSASGQLSQSPL